MLAKRLTDTPCWVLAFGLWRRARVVRMLRKNVEVRFRIPSRKVVHYSKVDPEGPAIHAHDEPTANLRAAAPWADRDLAAADFPPHLCRGLEPGWKEDR